MPCACISVACNILVDFGPKWCHNGARWRPKWCQDAAKAVSKLCQHRPRVFFVFSIFSVVSPTEMRCPGFCGFLAKTKFPRTPMFSLAQIVETCISLFYPLACLGAFLGCSLDVSVGTFSVVCSDFGAKSDAFGAKRAPGVPQQVRQDGVIWCHRRCWPVWPHRRC